MQICLLLAMAEVQRCKAAEIFDLISSACVVSIHMQDGLYTCWMGEM